MGQVAAESIYRDHAEVYARFSERSATNAWYDRPAILRLAGDVAGKRVLVFSVHHPITGWLLSGMADYHRTELVRETWDWDGQQVTAAMYRRPLSAIFGELRLAGFVVDVVDEPRPQQAADVAPELFEVPNSKPVFLFVRAFRS